MKQISKRRFDVYCYVRDPRILLSFEEIDWYEAGDGKLLAVVVRCRIDNDFGFVIFGRDARKIFRCIEPCHGFCETPEQSIANLEIRINKYINDGEEFYHQGDEELPVTDVYKLVVAKEKVHPYFTRLSEEPKYEAAKNLIKEAMHSFIDVDGNYIEQFQTSGFNARLWELYLYIYLNNYSFIIENEFSAPDYCLSRLGYKCFIEAMTVGPSQGFDVPQAKTGEEVCELSVNYLPIKFGSALHSKLNRKKKYWEMEHVAGHPLIFAIHDYHVPAEGGLPGSMTWSRAGLVNYLNGQRDFIEVVDGKECVRIEKLEKHTFGGKTIPSCFFKQPDTENVSAILFSNSATLPTFNRMGKLAGLGSANVKMIRHGVKRSLDPDSPYPIPFSVDIDDDDYEEAWADGLTMFHNPNALHPVDPLEFPDITHIWTDLDTGESRVLFSPNEIPSSVTEIFIPTTKN